MEFDSSQPIYLQIVDFFRLQIAAGTLQPGERVCAVRDISAEFSVNPNTVQKALAVLEQQDLMFTERTNGRFVTRNTAVIERLRQELLAARTRQYLHFLVELGYSTSDAVTLLAPFIEEDND